VGSRIEAVHEPRSLTDRGADSQPVLLGEDEGLEVIPDKRLVDAPPERAKRFGLEEERVAAQPCGKASDGRWRAGEGASDLAMGTPGDQSCRDGSQQLGSLEVVAGGEALP
jgi:hypothetical protein